MNRIDQAIRDAEGTVTRVMEKHTPGPWRVVGKGTGDDCIRGPKNRDSSSILIAVMGDHNERDDDAKLIAAAPEMLEALEAVVAVSFFDTWLETQPAYEMVKDAIRKAKGER